MLKYSLPALVIGFVLDLLIGEETLILCMSRVVHWWWVYRLSFRNSLLQRMFFTSA